MCYSAQIVADYRRYVREFGAGLDIKEFVDIFWHRLTNPKVKIPKAMEAAFAEPRTESERDIKAAIDEYVGARATALERDLFAQRKRLADAERSLEVKTTKKAQDDRRIATGKVGQIMGWLSDLRRAELTDLDSRIYPMHYAPVLVVENGLRVVKPMRYQCRPAGKPAAYDFKFPGTYNARRDNLEGFWRTQFGVTHGIVIMSAFYENVPRHRAENRELAADETPSNVVLEFRPRPQQDMLVACLWSRWTAPGQPDLLSFAAITDDPPEEIAIAGHDRCIIPIRHENLDAWLNADKSDLPAHCAILDDRARPHYEFRLAA